VSELLTKRSGVTKLCTFLFLIIIPDLVKTAYVYVKSRDSSVVIVMGYGLDDHLESIPGSCKIFLCSIMSRPGLGLIQSPIQSVLGALSLEVKVLGHETDQLRPPSAKVKNGGAVPSILHISSLSTGTTLPFLCTCY
jgi:hypothetical protein